MVRLYWSVLESEKGVLPFRYYCFSLVLNSVTPAIFCCERVPTALAEFARDILFNDA